MAVPLRLDTWAQHRLPLSQRHCPLRCANAPGGLGNLCDFPVTSPKRQPNLPQTEATHTLLGQAWSLLLVGALREMSQLPECCKLGFMTLHL